MNRLDWGCGPLTDAHEGWTTSDESEYAQSLLGRYPDHLGRIQDGLPWADGHFAYVVSHHALMGLPEVDLVPALVELRRVTKPGGWLRVSVPDMRRAILALRASDLEWFPLEADTTDEAFCRYVTQNGATRSVFTRRRLVHLLRVSGWENPIDVVFGFSTSGLDGITELDSRPNESIFMEARNGG